MHKHLKLWIKSTRLREKRDFEVGIIAKGRAKQILIPAGPESTDRTGELLLDRTGELLFDWTGEPLSLDCFFSAVRTLDNAAIAAALCEEAWLAPAGLGAEPDFGGDGELKAEFKAANAEALWVGPPAPFDLCWFWNIEQAVIAHWDFLNIWDLSHSTFDW